MLSGLHNNLRQQTQVRFEEGVSGWNTNSKPGATKACGVSLSVLPPLKPYDLKCGNLTTREDNGDFLSNKDPGMKFGEAAVYSVNKKNYRTLENLIEFFRSELEGIGDAVFHCCLSTMRQTMPASTTKPDDNPSTINRLIKELLALFPRCSYIGYTATPFANILMDQQNDDELFREFFMVLGRPDNYIGAARVFGTVNDDADEDDDGDAEAIVRDIELDWFVNLDQEPFNSDWKDFIPFPNKLDSLEHMDRLPESLEEAVYSFIISICIVICEATNLSIRPCLFTLLA